MEIIKLNIGGHRYETTRVTLESIPDTFFTSLLSGKFPTVKDDNGAYFIDRDGQYFPPILTFLRTKEVVVSTLITVEDLEREATFYCLAPLIHHMQQMNRSGYVQSLRDILGIGPNLYEKAAKKYWNQNKEKIFDAIRRTYENGERNHTLTFLQSDRRTWIWNDEILACFEGDPTTLVDKKVAFIAALADCFAEAGFNGIVQHLNNGSSICVHFISPNFAVPQSVRESGTAFGPLYVNKAWNSQK